MARSRKKPSTEVVPATPVDDGPLPWEKQKGESAKAFHAFSLYRDLRETRSLAKVREILGETRAAGPTMVEPWSVKWRWVERCDAYDREEDRRAREREASARADAARLRTTVGTLALGAALAKLRGDPNAVDETGTPRPVHRLDPEKLDPSDVSRLMAEGNKLLAAGLGEAADLKGSILVTGPAVQALARDLLALAIERIEAVGRAVAENPEDADGIVLRNIDVAIEEAQGMFRRSIQR